MIKQMDTKSRSAIIFDFDGTLADSFDIFVEALQEATRMQTPMTDAEILKLRGLSTRGVIKELGIKKWQLPLFIYRGKKGIAHRANRVHLFDDINDQVRQLYDSGYSLYIVSSNNRATIEKVLNEAQIADCFVDIVANAGIFSKAKKLTHLMKKYDIAPERSVYAGDESRDIEAATSIGMKSVAVGWGYSTPESLVSMKPDGYAKSPKMLAETIVSVAK